MKARRRDALALALGLVSAGCAVGTVPEIPELGGRDGFGVVITDDDGIDAGLDEDRDAGGDEDDADDVTLPPLDLTLPEDVPPADLGCAFDPGRACTPGSRQACGRCGAQTCSSGCDWGACADEGECSPGATRGCGTCGSQTCLSNCSWGACAGGGGCTPGARRACGNCGSQTCGSDCAWGACTSQGECAPGATRGGGCDPCSQQVCQSNCSWGGCGLRPGSACEYRAGRNNRACSACRCGLQWCLNSCQWSTACTSCCTTCGGCQ